MSLPQIEDKNLNALAAAIRANDPNAVRSILDAHRDLANREYGTKHQSFLHFAIWLDSAKSGSAVSYEIYRLLIQYGADPNKVDKSGNSLNCLLYALSYPIIRSDPHSLNKLALLVRSTRNLNYQPPGVGGYTALLAAIRVQSTIPIAEKLIKQCGVDTNLPIIYPQNRKLYPLSCAMLNHVPPVIIQALLDYGADVHRPDPRGRDHPLFLCVERARMPVEYLSLLVSYGMDTSILNAKGQNALQVLLQRQVDHPTIRAKIRVLIRGGVDVRSPCVVGYVSSEQISILHYIIHDGIAVQHRSESTQEIGQQLQLEFTEGNYEHAKITFHRTKSLRSRESHGNLQTLLQSPSSSHHHSNNQTPQQQAQDGNLQTPRQKLTSSPSHSPPRFTSPRASEHSLRFSASAIDLHSPHVSVGDIADRSTPSSPMGLPTSPIQEHAGADSSNNNNGQLMVDVNTGMPTSTMMTDSNETSPISNELAKFNGYPSEQSLRDSGTAFFGLPLIPVPTLQRQFSQGSNHTSASNASQSQRSQRSQRSYATMSSYHQLPEDTIKRLEAERTKQDVIDACDLAEAIEAAINLISINFDPVVAHGNDEGFLSLRQRNQFSKLTQESEPSDEGRDSGSMLSQGSSENHFHPFHNPDLDNTSMGDHPTTTTTTTTTSLMSAHQQLLQQQPQHYQFQSSSSMSMQARGIRQPQYGQQSHHGIQPQSHHILQPSAQQQQLQYGQSQRRQTQNYSEQQQHQQRNGYQ